MVTKPLITAVALASLVLPQTLHAHGDNLVWSCRGLVPVFLEQCSL